MALQSVPTLLLLSILAVTVALGHAVQKPRLDLARHVPQDEVTKDMYTLLMGRLEQQEASLRQLQITTAEKEQRIERLENELQEIKMDVGFQQRHQVSPSETVPKHLKEVPQFFPNLQQNGVSEEPHKTTFPSLDDAKVHIVKRQRTNTGVAFSTSMQNDMSVQEHETLIFGHVISNEGSGYNSGDGIFIVPQSGVYVFTWSITSEINHSGVNDIHTNLMLNGSEMGGIDSDADSGNWGSATGVVVMSVETGDHVYIRVTTGSSGIIISRTAAKSTFSGWLLF